MRLKFEIINEAHSHDIQTLLINELDAGWVDISSDNDTLMGMKKDQSVKEVRSKYLFYVDGTLWVSNRSEDYNAFEGRASSLHDLFTKTLNPTYIHLH